MSHRTNLRDIDRIVDEAMDDFVAALEPLRGAHGAEHARCELARNALIQYVADKRSDFPTRAVINKLAGVIGPDAKGPSVRGVLERLEAKALGRALLERLLEQAILNEAAAQPIAPLPLGVASPVPGAIASTPARGKPVVAREAYASSDGAPTRPVGGQRDVVGPWPGTRRKR
jgi:hypothetical protein